MDAGTLSWDAVSGVCGLGSTNPRKKTPAPSSLVEKMQWGGGEMSLGRRAAVRDASPEEMIIGQDERGRASLAKAEERRDPGLCGQREGTEADWDVVRGKKRNLDCFQG